MGRGGGRGRKGGGRGGGRGREGRERLCVSANLKIERKDVWFALSHFDVLAVGFLEQFLIV